MTTATAQWDSVFIEHQDRDEPTTWFIDPPYQRANKRGYRYRLNEFDYSVLREMVLHVAANGHQVIVCEQDGADWLPFQPLCLLKTHGDSISQETVWTSSPWSS